MREREIEIIRLGKWIGFSSFRLWALKGDKMVYRLPLMNLFFNMDLIYSPNKMDELVKGMVMQKGMMVDKNFPKAVMRELELIKGEK